MAASSSPSPLSLEIMYFLGLLVAKALDSDIVAPYLASTALKAALQVNSSLGYDWKQINFSRV